MKPHQTFFVKTSNRRQNTRIKSVFQRFKVEIDLDMIFGYKSDALFINILVEKI